MSHFKCAHAISYWFVLLFCPAAWAVSPPAAPLPNTPSAVLTATSASAEIGPATSTLRPEYADDSAASDEPAAPSGIRTLEWRAGETDVPPSEQSENGESDADVWQRIRNGFKFSETDNPLTAVHERWYAARPDYVKRMLERSRRYLFHIANEVERRGMPMEIALLPMIESAFNPKAYSTADASGIWQFIASTGRHYGLKQDNWYDGRRDITAATNAALDYLGKLYLDFGDWQLALAAYNCGEGCVARAIQKNARLGLPTDYASLALSTETRHYVPKLLAIKHLILDPEYFGVALDTLPNQPYFSQVEMRASMDVRSAARLAGMDVDEFTALNPAFSRNLIRSDTPVNILVPVDKTDHFENNLKNGVWDTWKLYHARKGERLTTLAKRFDTTTTRLKDHNSLALRNGKLARAQTLLVPVKGRGVDTDGDELTSYSPADTQRHIVDRGETLYAVARRYGKTVSAFKRANPHLGDRLIAGESLRVPDASGGEMSAAGLTKVAFVRDSIRTGQSTRPDAHKVQKSYTIKRGDTLGGIAARLAVSVSQLKAWNPWLRKSSRIQAGKRLRLH